VNRLHESTATSSATCFMPRVYRLVNSIETRSAFQGQPPEPNRRRLICSKVKREEAQEERRATQPPKRNLFCSTVVPFTYVSLRTIVFVEQFWGRAVRRASHDSMSLGRFRFSASRCWIGVCFRPQPDPPPVGIARSHENRLQELLGALPASRSNGECTHVRLGCQLECQERAALAFSQSKATDRRGPEGNKSDSANFRVARHPLTMRLFD